MKKKFLSIMFTIVLVLTTCIIPHKNVVALGQMLYVGAVDLAAGHPYTVDGSIAIDDPGEGNRGEHYALYDSSTQTLTLHAFNSNNHSYVSNNSSYGIYSSIDDDININMEGDSIVSSAKADGYSFGILEAMVHTITFGGNGSLNVSSGHNDGDYSAGIFADADIVVNSGTLYATGYNSTGLMGTGTNGIFAGGNLIINGGCVRAESVCSDSGDTVGAIRVAQGIYLSNVVIKTPLNAKIKSGNLDISIYDGNQQAKLVLIEADDGDDNCGCDHNYEWEIEKEPTTTEEGEADLKCTKCGAVKERQPISAYAYYIMTSTNKIKNAPAGTTVTISSKIWNSFPKSFFEELAARRDITVKIQFPYNHKDYEATILPTQIIDTSDTQVEYYGPQNLINMYNAAEVEAK